ncbi:MAG: glycosyltransferase family 4 protein [Candidatus Binatia bacterium]
MKAMFVAVVRGLTDRPGFYVSVNANRGMYATAFIAGVGRVLGCPVALHHHSNAYVLDTERRMRFLARCAGPRALHVVVCDVLGEELRCRYPAVERTTALSNIMAVEEISPGPRRSGGRLRLGHLSNLTREKGFFLVLRLFEMLLREGIDVSLVLAGPARQREVSAALTEALRVHGDRIDYRGPVYGRAKAQFYSDIDVFLFPSIYRHETQGIVNLEALGAGVPVIAYGRACIPGDLGHGGGLVVRVDEDFGVRAGELIREWNKDRSQLAEAKAMARGRFLELRSASHRQLEILLAQLAGNDLPPQSNL